MLPLKTTIRTPAATGEEDDAVGEHQLVAAVGELAGQVAVAGDDRRQGRGTRRRPCWRRGSRMANVASCVTQNSTFLPPKTCSAISAMPVGSLVAAVRLEVGGEHRDAEEAGAEDRRPSSPASCDALRLSGLRNDGTPFDTASTPDSATAPDENARRSMRRLSGLVPCGELLGLRGQRRRAGSGRGRWKYTRYRPTPISSDQHHDVEVRRRGEQRPGLPQPAEVGDRHQR